MEHQKHINKQSYEQFKQFCISLQENDYNKEFNFLNLLTLTYKLSNFEQQNILLLNLFDTFTHFYQFEEIQIFFQHITDIIHCEQWLPCQGSLISVDATPFGIDISNNDLYFARIPFQNELIIGKCSELSGGGIFPIEQKEKKILSFEVFCLTQKPYFFKHKKDDEFPKFGIPMGHLNKHILFGARFHHENTLQLGYCTSDGIGTFTYGKQIFQTSDFEILGYQEGIYFKTGMEWKIDEIISKKIESFIFSIMNYKQQTPDFDFFDWSKLWNFFEAKFK